MVFVLFLVLDLIAGVLRAPWISLYHSSTVDIFISALAVGQISVAAIWLATRQRHDIASYILPTLAITAATYLQPLIYQSGLNLYFTLLDYACRCLLQTIAVLIPVAALVRTPLWRWVCRGKRSLPLRFSFVHLLAWTTCAAIFATLLRHATWVKGVPLVASTWQAIVAPAVVAVAVLLVRQIRWIGPSRIILNMLIGAEVGVLVASITNRHFMAEISNEFMVQAILITIAVEIGRYGDFVTADAELTEIGGASRDATRG